MRTYVFRNRKAGPLASSESDSPSVCLSGKVLTNIPLARSASGSQSADLSDKVVTGVLSSETFQEAADPFASFSPHAKTFAYSGSAPTMKIMVSLELENTRARSYLDKGFTNSSIYRASTLKMDGSPLAFCRKSFVLSGVLLLSASASLVVTSKSPGSQQNVTQ